MQALVLNKSEESPQYQSFELPPLQEGEVEVRLRAAALNHRDVWITKGMYPGIVYPIILGSDGVGELDQKPVILNPSIGWGPNPNVRARDYKVIGLPTHGTFSELIRIPKQQVYPMPAHLEWEQAAALPLAGLTAYRVLFSKANLKAGEKVLISGIGGGVAQFACQFALAAGAEVYVTSGSDGKIAKAIEMGATGGVNYKTEDWHRRIKKAVGGFDVIVDSAGGPGFTNLIKTCNAGARIAIYGGTRGTFEGLSPQHIFWKQISIFGSFMGTDDEFEAMLDFVNEHKIVPVVDAVFSLQNGTDAFQRMNDGLQFGKIVLRIN